MAMDMDDLYSAVMASAIDPDRGRKSQLMDSIISGKRTEIAKDVFSTVSAGLNLVDDLDARLDAAKAKASEGTGNQKSLALLERLMDFTASTVESLKL